MWRAFRVDQQLGRGVCLHEFRRAPLCVGAGCRGLLACRPTPAAAMRDPRTCRQAPTASPMIQPSCACRCVTAPRRAGPTAGRARSSHPDVARVAAAVCRDSCDIVDSSAILCAEGGGHFLRGGAWRGQGCADEAMRKATGAVLFASQWCRGAFRTSTACGQRPGSSPTLGLLCPAMCLAPLVHVRR